MLIVRAQRTKSRRLLFLVLGGANCRKSLRCRNLPVLLDQLAVRNDLSFSKEIDFEYDRRRKPGASLAIGIELLLKRRRGARRRRFVHPRASFAWSST